MTLILTTYPQKRSANVGDLLITASFAEMARSIGVLDDYEIAFRADELTDDLLERYGSSPIFMPGFSISADSYPTLYALRKALDEIPRGLIPFGCSWQHPIGFAENAEQVEYTPETLQLLKLLVDRTGPIAVRDHMAERILMRHSIPSIVVGDCGWYHLPSRGKPMRRPDAIRKVIVTTPHSADLEEQSKALIDMLFDLLPDAAMTLSLHSKPQQHEKYITEYARAKGMKVIHAFKNFEVFDDYENYDLHVGHRLHGHIGFLRRRIPSVLLVEDARARGFSTTIPTGCFDAKATAIRKDVLAKQSIESAKQSVYPDEGVVPRVRDHLIQEMQSRFLRYVGIAPYLDGMLNEVALPQLAQKVALAKAAIGPAAKSKKKWSDSAPAPLRRLIGRFSQR